MKSVVPKVKFDIQEVRFKTRREAESFIREHHIDDYWTHHAEDSLYIFWADEMADLMDKAAAAEREACAVTCERVKSDGMAGPRFWLDWDILDDAIAAIRARGKCEND